MGLRPPARQTSHGLSALPKSACTPCLLLKHMLLPDAPSLPSPHCSQSSKRHLICALPSRQRPALVATRCTNFWRAHCAPTKLGPARVKCTLLSACQPQRSMFPDVAVSHKALARCCSYGSSMESGCGEERNWTSGATPKMESSWEKYNDRGVSCNAVLHAKTSLYRTGARPLLCGLLSRSWPWAL